jgi:hypothetical protein
MSTQTLVYLIEIERAREHGLPWASIDSARWDFRQRRQRGTVAAWVRIGRRIAVDPARYHELVRSRAAS